MTRREFIAIAVGATTWPLAARAQQSPLPVIGYLSGRSAVEAQYLVEALHAGLRDGGFVAGQNVTFEFRWADSQYDRLPQEAADLVGRQVSLIVASGAVQAIQAAKSATSAIPIVFVTGDDPVKFGIVASLNKPGGNITGISALTQQMEAKRLEILHQLLPPNKPIGVLVNRTNPSATIELQQTTDAASTLGHPLDVLDVASAADIERAFSILTQHGVGAVTVISDPFMNTHREQLVELATRHMLPSVLYSREQATAGALISYGASFPAIFRQAGVYAARILKGEKPGDLPVLQPTKFELVINLKTANTLGLAMPDKLMALADEVIE